ncbi:CRISPR-associated endonuclease Cas1 [Pelodictyon phaeoclathratiforme]|jgi:CRISPR-associated protein Cas1|uniref:CRISPR-associated endonuclease Cas1 n=1 Tax=Pelodictyon phaeoclathratiforme (strain DSM 5477 / BU-1) TaxID=324925 RepID=B4SEW7_PELPB|nr:CRISPR-associated endonuclease Cas1 [Pelodictyon phaeoclathratiforme]ACF44643.1 CRISPR-associated protein Cas1 [Pelodictyon phaeoclathratiforme BU-1]MBV5288931.1 CRISPR-associated endonuclease Cas1 [Pelodictyon phaeoclathratiforme]
MGWLYNQMALPETLFQAWNKVVSNDGMAGYDKQSITDYSWRIEEHLADLGRQLLTNTYEPQPLLKLVMLKPTGKLRTLLIPTVMERVAQTAAAIVLTPLVESELGANTFAYRPGLSRMTAAREIERLRNLGYNWVVDADISSFFDTVDHPLLFQRFRELCDDEELLTLIARWLTAEIVDGQNPKVKNTIGLPQGCPISPMLANLYLDKFDERMEQEGFKLVRFADDFLILCKSKPKAEAALQLSESALAELKLQLNNEKTRITTFAEGFKYLGYLFIRSLVLPTKMHPDEWYDKLGKLKLRKAPKSLLHPEESDDEEYELQTGDSDAITVTKETLLQTEFGEKLLQSLEKQQIDVDKFLEKTAKEDALRQKEKHEALNKLYSPLLNTLYLQEQGSILRKDGERFSVEKEGKQLNDIIVRRVEQILVLGNITLTTPAMQYCMKSNIPITFVSQHGSYFGRLEATTADNSALERFQYLRSLDEPFALGIASAIVEAKIRNSRTMIQKRKAMAWESNGELKEKFDASLLLMTSLAEHTKSCDNMEALRGIEGKAAALYFELFGLLFKKELPFYTSAFRRVRRPPTDPVNSLLSFGYTLLHNNIFSLVRMKGMNPYLGFLHAEDKGNPALINDLVEEFRTIIDSMTLYTLNKGVLRNKDFYYRKDKAGCFLTDEARKKFLELFEQRMWAESLDPQSGKSLNIRRHIESQVVKISEVLAGTRAVYEPWRSEW